MTTNIVPFRAKSGDTDVLYVMIHMVMEAIQHFAYVEKNEFASYLLMDSARAAV